MIIKYILTFLLFLLPLVLSGQTKKVEAVRTETEINLDGKLDEKVWSQTRPANDFVVKDPIEGALPEETAEVRFVYDNDYLYIGCRMWRKEPEKIQSFIARRDNMGNSERIIISLDTYNDGATAYTFAITATGVRSDYFHASDDEGDRDYNYDPIWSGKSHIDSLGWTAELRLPFNQLRFNEADELVWGININQYTPTNREDIYWVLIPKNSSGWSSKFGKLQGLRGIKQSKRIELTPYITAGLEYDTRSIPNDPYYNKWDKDLRYGVDFKMGLGPNITLDATVLPDFGQVEADPAVINLTEFETYFDEKRQFFIEGNNLFQNSQINYYYSRRIGATSYYPSSSNYSDMPNSSTLLAATKLTGRLGSGLSFGLMSCLTDSEFGYFRDSASAPEHKEIVQPLAFYNIFRIKQETDQQGSYFGLLITSVNRNNETNELKLYNNDAGYSGGVDWSLYFDDKTYLFEGNIGMSYVLGSTSRMIKLQRETTQNFQRPDASHLSVDSSANSLSGLVGHLGLSKIAGKHWLFGTKLLIETPELNLNDFGRLMHADEITPSFDIRYRENKPNNYFQAYSFTLSQLVRYNFAGEMMTSVSSFKTNLSFLNKSSLVIGVNATPINFSDTRTRGGIKMAITPDLYWWLYYSTDWSKPFQFIASFDNSFSLTEKNYYDASVRFIYNYTRWKFDVLFNYTFGRDDQQYIATLDGGNPDTYFKRYLFGKLDKNSLSTSFKVNYSFTPDLTIECFAEPAFTDGKYLSYSELKNNKSYKMKEYGKAEGTTISFDNERNATITDGNETFSIERMDFFFKSLRSNIVLRWEYQSGCVLYAVWQFANQDYTNYWKTLSFNEYNSVFSNAGINNFMIKFSYWLPVD